MLLVFAACKKGYFPGVKDESGINILPAPEKPYTCASCVGADNFTENKWSFYNVDTFYCGIIDTAIATPDRNGFTVFGPSSCSSDSGLVLTINIDPVRLTKDLQNLTTTKAGLYYYDNIGQSHPFVTRPGTPFSFIIDSYIHQTRMMTGRYTGTVYKPDGQATTIFGKYKVRMM